MAQNNYTGTPHISAKKGHFPQTVLFPGDPLRAKWIAETFLKDVKVVNEVRGMLGFVGTYKGHKVGVMGSGMGMPSAGIYSHELFDFYDVENIIRIGTAGGYDKDVAVGTILIGSQAYSDSTYAQVMGIETDKPKIMYANSELVKLVKSIADEIETPYIEGMIHSTDAFYGKGDFAKMQDLKIKGVEMEAFAIYVNAKKFNKKALTIATVSDNIVTGENMSPHDRQTKLVDMVHLALEAAIRYKKG